jgi:hypothetical protein
MKWKFSSGFATKPYISKIEIVSFAISSRSEALTAAVIHNINFSYSSLTKIAQPNIAPLSIQLLTRGIFSMFTSIFADYQAIPAHLLLQIHCSASRSHDSWESQNQSDHFLNDSRDNVVNEDGSQGIAISFCVAEPKMQLSWFFWLNLSCLQNCRCL